MGRRRGRLGKLRTAGAPSYPVGSPLHCHLDVWCPFSDYVDHSQVGFCTPGRFSASLAELWGGHTRAGGDLDPCLLPPNIFLSQLWLEVKRIIQRGGKTSTQLPDHPVWPVALPFHTRDFWVSCSPAPFPFLSWLCVSLFHIQKQVPPSASFVPGTLLLGHFVSFRPSGTLGGGRGTLTLRTCWVWKLRLAQVTQLWSMGPGLDSELWTLLHPLRQY